MAYSGITDQESVFSRLKIDTYDHDPDSTAATDVLSTWLDMRDYGKFACIVFSSALTGSGATVVQICANSAADGTGDEVVIKNKVVTTDYTAPDAVGDWVVIECTAAEINYLGEASGYDLRYVSPKITLQNAADECVVVCIRAEPRFPQTGLTTDYAAA